MLSCNLLLQYLNTVNQREATYSSGVSSFSSALNLTAQPKVSNLADKLSVDQHITCCQVSMYIVHLGEILHPRCNAAQHSC